MTKTVCDKCASEKDVVEVQLKNVSYLLTANSKIVSDDLFDGKRRRLHGRPRKIELCNKCRVALAHVLKDFLVDTHQPPKPESLDILRANGGERDEADQNAYR